MIRHDAIDDADLRRLILVWAIRYGGNQRLGIYGRLDCASGRRMKRRTRVFFAVRMLPVLPAFAPVGIVCQMPIKSGGALRLAFWRELRHIACVVP